MAYSFAKRVVSLDFRGISFNPVYVANAVDFPDQATPKWLTLGSSLVSSGQTKMMWSYWLHPYSLGAGVSYFVASNGSIFTGLGFSHQIQWTGSAWQHVIRVYEGAATKGNFTGPVGGADQGVWTHWLISADFSGTPTFQVYKNDVMQTTTPSAITTQIDSHLTPMYFGIRTDLAQSLKAGVADFWWCGDDSLDIDIVTNRRKFISAAGKPVNLGTNGTNPGITPQIFLSNPAATWHVNNGSAGGSFTVNSGTLVPFSSSPSD